MQLDDGRFLVAPSRYDKLLTVNTIFCLFFVSYLRKDCLILRHI